MNDEEYEFAVRSYALLRTFLEPGSPLSEANQKSVQEFLATVPDSISAPGDDFFQLVWDEA